MSQSMQPRALVLRAPGINCDRETAYACRLAGFATDLLHINQLIKEPQRLLDYHFLVIPGGFSYGDDLGAGTLLAKNLTIHLGKQLEQFIDEERLILGICNGFQALVRAGLLPGQSEETARHATLTDNASAQFECRWITLAVLPGRCIFTRGITHPIQLPVAHGEGQFVLRGDITHLLAQRQVPLIYAPPGDDPVYGRGDPGGRPANPTHPTNPTRPANPASAANLALAGNALSGTTLSYPYNPNGSLENVAGMCNAFGNILGLMPHPERYVSALQHPQRNGMPDGTGDGLLIFKNAYEYASRRVADSRFIVKPRFKASSHIGTTSYAASGVDIAAADQAKALMKEAVRSTHSPAVLAGMGAFAGVIDITSVQQMRKPALVASTDGVGTKTLIAAQAGRYDTIGYDLVNHSVNDLLTQGARPLFFMDYLAMGKLDAGQAATIVSGVAGACREIGGAHGQGKAEYGQGKPMPLLGGETAEMPDVYLPGAFDLAGTIVGIVEQDTIIDGSAIRPGDMLLGLPSSGLHTNGYSLARKVFEPFAYETIFPDLGEPLVDALLRPHRCYLREVQALQGAGIDIKGIAHITGGGFEGNIARILPAGVQAVIETSAWNVPPLFLLISRLGKISREEMYRTFNMGAGMVLVFTPDEAARARAIVLELFSVGYITDGNGVTIA